MKTSIRITLFFISFFVMAFSCKKDGIEAKYIEGYIIGFDPCAVNQQFRLGFVVVSADLKDTLVTYCLSDKTYSMPANVTFNSDTLYKIPATFFQNYQCSSRFPENARYEFKINISYVYASKQEIVDYFCTADIMAFEFYDKPQIIIKSVTKK